MKEPGRFSPCHLFENSLSYSCPMGGAGYLESKPSGSTDGPPLILSKKFYQKRTPSLRSPFSFGSNQADFSAAFAILLKRRKKADNWRRSRPPQQGGQRIADSGQLIPIYPLSSIVYLLTASPPISLPGLYTRLPPGVLLLPLLWPDRRWRRPEGPCLRRG